MKRLKYQSKNKHVTIALDVYSPRETVAMWKQDIKKFRTWLRTPKKIGEENYLNLRLKRSNS